MQDMQDGLLKYTYSPTTNNYTMQLYVQSDGGAFGEVSFLAGGVILPAMYKLPLDLNTGQTVRCTALS